MSFLNELLSSSDKYSFGRFASLLTLAFVLGWDTANLVFAWRFNQHLPQGFLALPLLPDALVLAGQAAFMVTFYGVTKYGDLKSLQQPQPPPSAPSSAGGQ